MQQILVVDDEMGIRELLSEILADEGFEVRLAENAAEAREQRAKARPDLVLLDIWMPDADGITLLREWAANGLLTMPVVMMSGHGTIETAVEATRIGAFDFLEKPIALQKLLATVTRALRHGEREPRPALSLAAMGRAPIINELKVRLERVRNLRSPLMLLAAPGSGAELCARFLHNSNTPWVAPVSLGVLAESPLDLLEQAREGTLFLYEVADLSRLEQRGLVLAIGKQDKYNTRIVCATARPLAEEVAAGTFDAKLYAALSAVSVAVPALAQHREDIPELASLMLSRLVEAREVPHKVLSTAALNVLRNRDWPGNLTQLESVVRSAALTTAGEEVKAYDVGRVVAGGDAGTTASAQGLPLDLPLREARDAFERVYFDHHIQKEGGNMSRVADRVGLERTHLYRKLKQLGIRVSKRGTE